MPSYVKFMKELLSMIQTEGVESLSEKELILACRERGILGSCLVKEMGEEVGAYCLFQ